MDENESGVFFSTPKSVRDFARKAGITRQGADSLLKRKVRKGLLRQVVSPDNRAVLYVSASAIVDGCFPKKIEDRSLDIFSQKILAFASTPQIYDDLWTASGMTRGRFASILKKLLQTHRLATGWAPTGTEKVYVLAGLEDKFAIIDYPDGDIRNVLRSLPFGLLASIWRLIENPISADDLASMLSAEIGMALTPARIQTHIRPYLWDQQIKRWRRGREIYYSRGHMHLSNGFSLSLPKPRHRRQRQECIRDRGRILDLAAVTPVRIKDIASEIGVADYVAGQIIRDLARNRHLRKIRGRDGRTSLWMRTGEPYKSED